MVKKLATATTILAVSTLITHIGVVDMILKHSDQERCAALVMEEDHWMKMAKEKLVETVERPVETAERPVEIAERPVETAERPVETAVKQEEKLMLLAQQSALAPMLLSLVTFPVGKAAGNASSQPSLQSCYLINQRKALIVKESVTNVKTTMLPALQVAGTALSHTLKLLNEALSNPMA